LIHDLFIYVVMQVQ